MKKEILYLIIVGIFYGTIYAGAQMLMDIGFTAYETTLIMMAFSSVMFLAAMRAEHVGLRDIKPQFFLLYGLCSFGCYISEFGALALGIPIAIGVLLMYTQPIWTIILGKFLLNERITRAKLLALFLGMLGVAISVGVWNAEFVYSPLGIMLGLITGLCFAIFIIYGKKAQGSTGLSPATTGFCYYGGGTLWAIFAFVLLALSNATFAVDVGKLSLLSLFYFAVYALVSAVIPGLLFYHAVRKVEAGASGLIMLLEIPIAAILGVLLFAQLLTLEILVGGALILIADAVAIVYTQN
ncbi:MAG: DMT family transporter [Candidatus Micrarchaeota archaeon]